MTLLLWNLNYVFLNKTSVCKCPIVLRLDKFLPDSSDLLHFRVDPYSFEYLGKCLKKPRTIFFVLNVKTKLALSRSDRTYETHASA